MASIDRVSGLRVMRIAGVLGGIVALGAAIAIVNWLSQTGIEDSGRKPVAATVKQESRLHKPAETASGKNEKGEFTTSPFEQPKKGPFPKLEIDSKEHNFGLMRFDPAKKKGGEHRFVIRNAGEAPLLLARGPSTCQCTMAQMEDQVSVPPGGSTEVTVTWNPEFVTEDFVKGASLWTNDPALFADGSESKDGRISLNVKGVVVNGVEVDPPTFALGTLEEGRPTTISAVIFSRVHEQLDVQLAETSSRLLTAELQPMDAEALTEKKARSGWTLTGTLQPNVNIGRVKESITLTTSDPDVPKSVIEISGHRQGPITIGGRFWNGADTVLDFKRFQASDGVQTALYAYAARKEPRLEISVVEIRPAELEVTIVPDDSFQDPDRERVQIKVRVPPGLPPDRLIGKNAGRIVLKTNREEAPEIRAHVIYESN